MFSAANGLRGKSITGSTRLAAHLHQTLFYVGDTATAAVFPSVRPRHHPGESHMSGPTIGQSSAYICVLPVCPALTDALCVRISRSYGKYKTPQYCQASMKSLKYSTNLHKSLGVGPLFFFFIVWWIIFLFVVQALQLLAVCISNTNSSCSEDSSNFSPQRKSQECLFRAQIQELWPCSAVTALQSYSLQANVSLLCAISATFNI